MIIFSGYKSETSLISKPVERSNGSELFDKITLNKIVKNINQIKIK